MRVFVTGASGFIGSVVVPDLIAAGHTVVGLARSETSAQKVIAHGAEVLRGDVTDPALLAKAAAAADGVIHLAFIHDGGDFEAASKIDRAAVDAMLSALEGTNKPFVLASGMVGLLPGRVVTEDTTYDARFTRTITAQHVMAAKDRGIRVSAVRLCPTTHGQGDHGLVAMIAGIARQKGFSAFIGDGSNRWSAVHRLDAAPLFRLALERAEPGTIFHAVAEEGITARAIAEALGTKLGVEARSVAPDKAAEHFGPFLGLFFGIDQPASSAITQAKLGWKPTHQGLLADIDAGYYTT